MTDRMQGRPGGRGGAAEAVDEVCRRTGVPREDAERALMESRLDVEAAIDLLRRKTPMRGR